MTGTRVPVVIVGAGGHGRELLDIVEALPDQGGLSVVGFLSGPRDDLHLVEARGYRVLGPVERQPEVAEHHLLAVGWSDVRRHVAGLLSGTPVSVVHPTAVVPRPASGGAGLVAAAGARLGPGATVGEHVHLNVQAVVGSSVVLGDFTTVSPGAQVGDGAVLRAACFVGAGARVRAGCTLGEGCVVGAGAVVEDDVAPGTKVVGRPATPVRRHA